MTDSSMASIVTDVSVEPASDQDSGHQGSPTRSEVNEHKVVCTLDNPARNSVTRNLSCTSVPETPGVSRSSSLVSVGNYYSSQALHDVRAIPTRGTPSAIGALKLPRNSLYTAATPFKNPGSLRILHRAEAVQDSEVDSDSEEREKEEAQLVLAVARAQRKVYGLEQQLMGARVEESESLGKLYRFRMEEAQRRAMDANVDIGLIRRDISKNNSSFQKEHKRCRTSSLHESFTATASGSPEY